MERRIASETLHRYQLELNGSITKDTWQYDRYILSTCLTFLLSSPHHISSASLYCMSIRRTKSSNLKASKNSLGQEVENRKTEEVMRPKEPYLSMATSSSLNSIHISPRTPKSPKVLRMGLYDAEEGVELTLLGEEERREAQRVEIDIPSKRPIGAKDKRGMVLLCVLCECSFVRVIDDCD
jgi:hypothetical protein